MKNKKLSWCFIANFVMSFKELSHNLTGFQLFQSLLEKPGQSSAGRKLLKFLAPFLLFWQIVMCSANSFTIFSNSSFLDDRLFWSEIFFRSVDEIDARSKRLITLKEEKHPSGLGITDYFFPELFFLLAKKNSLLSHSCHSL